MNQHTISLRGPWTARTVVSGEVRSMRMNIKSFADWNAWQSEFPDARELTLERKFNWLFPEPAPEKVELQVKCPTVPTGKLNGQAIVFEGNGAVCSCTITHLLESANRLELQFRLDQAAGRALDLQWVEMRSHG